MALLTRHASLWPCLQLIVSELRCPGLKIYFVNSDQNVLCLRFDEHKRQVPRSLIAQDKATSGQYDSYCRQGSRSSLGTFLVTLNAFRVMKIVGSRQGKSGYGRCWALTSMTDEANRESPRESCFHLLGTLYVLELSSVCHSP